MKYRYEVFVDAESQEQANKAISRLAMLAHDQELPEVLFKWDRDGNVSFG